MSFGPPASWWYDPRLKPFHQHPLAHAVGGVVFFLAPIADRWLYHHVGFPLFAAANASAAQLTWEIIQTEVTPGYSFADSGVWDWLTATVVAVVLAAIWSLVG